MQAADGLVVSPRQLTFITGHFPVDLILGMVSVSFTSLSLENIFRIKENEMENLPLTKDKGGHDCDEQKEGSR